MSQVTKYQYVKLGMNLEYLRGLSTASVALTSSLAAYPNLAANLPAQRSDASKVISVIKSLLIQLEELGAMQSLAAAGELRPMVAQMEAYLSEAPAARTIVLQDGFANQIVGVAKAVSLVLKQEFGSQVV